MRACILNNGPGDYRHLKIEELPDPTIIGDTEVLVRHSSIGINFDDIMYRRGDYIIPDEFGKNPVLGFEAVGNVVKIGSKVKGFQIGDKVGYAFCRLGAYAEMNVVDYRYIFSVPNDISTETACGVLRKGLIAYCMLFKMYTAFKNDWILIHSIAGGVGHILAKLAKHMGLNIIGTIGDESKMSFALSVGADHVIDRSKDDLLKKVIEFTDGKGVSAVYDGIGKSVFEASVNALKPFGIYISYGYSGGKLEPIDVFTLREKNLFFTTPTLELYMANRHELILSSATLLDFVKKGIVVPNISNYGFDGIQQAHIDMENKISIGSLVVNV